MIENWEGREMTGKEGGFRKDKRLKVGSNIGEGGLRVQRCGSSATHISSSCPSTSSASKSDWAWTLGIRESADGPELDSCTTGPDSADAILSQKS